MRPLMIQRASLVVDVESLLYSGGSFISSRLLSTNSDHPVIRTIAILLAFVPLLIVAYKVVLLLERKEVFKQSKSAKFAVFALLLIPLVYAPMTILSYVTESYVVITIFMIVSLAFVGRRLEISRRVMTALKVLERNSTLTVRSALFLVQLGLFVYLSTLLGQNVTWDTPVDLNYLGLGILSSALMITSYLIVSNSKLGYVSAITSFAFLSLFLALQGVINYGGDSGIFVSITKHMLNGDDADFISLEDRWRFGSLALLGHPTMMAFLSEISLVSPDYAISFANAVSIIFASLGGYVLSRLIGRSSRERNVIFGIYLLALPSTFYFVANNFRSVSFLLLLLPFTLPLFYHIKSGKLGSLVYLVAMVAIAIVHPLAFVIVAVMAIFLFSRVGPIGKVSMVLPALLFAALVFLSPSFLRILSVSPEEPPSLYFSLEVFDAFFDPLPTFPSADWPGRMTFMVSLAGTMFLLAVTLSMKVGNLPRIPIIVSIAAFFVAAVFVHTENFPIIRLSIFFGGIGLITAISLIIRKAYSWRIPRKSRFRTAGPTVAVTAIIMIVITSSYPWGRPLQLDTMSVGEYNLIKAFLTKEGHNFQSSIILAHIETMRYLNGIEGSILYYEGSKPFSFDFTDSKVASQFYDAFARTQKEDLSGALRLSFEKAAPTIYVVQMHRLFPNLENQQFDDAIISSEAGVIRKITFQDIELSNWQQEKIGVDIASLSRTDDGALEISGTFSKNYTAVRSTATLSVPVRAIVLDVTYNDKVIPRFFFISEDGTSNESERRIINGDRILVSSTKTIDEDIRGVTISLDSGRWDQYGSVHNYPITATLRINKVYLVN